MNARFGGIIFVKIEAKEIEIEAMAATIAVSGTVEELTVSALKNATVDCSNLSFSSKEISSSGGSVVKVKE